MRKLIVAAFHVMVANARAAPTFLGKVSAVERGAIDIGAILIMGIGMVFIAVGFIIYPIIMDACDDLLAYNCTLNHTIVASYFTGFSSIVGITPLLVLVGFLTAGVFSMYLGIQLVKGGGSTKIDLGSLLMLGISMIFIAIGLIILPVVLDAICDVFTPSISSTYTGLASILKVAPLLILISFISAAVVTGFFGIRKLGS